jgi:hypothetical protein
MDGPPEYPEVALTTPFTCWNTACTPQKHPPAKTAVAWPLFAETDSSTVGLGRTTAPLSLALAKMPAKVKSNKEAINRLKRDFNITILARISLRGSFIRLESQLPRRLQTIRGRDLRVVILEAIS